jgi:hypothetical protein
MVDLVFSPHFAVDKTVFAASETMLYRSVNQGRSWEVVKSWQGKSPLLCLDILSVGEDENSLLAGTETDGVYRSMDFEEWVSWGLEGAQISSVYQEPAGEALIAITDEQVFMRDKDMDAWQEIIRVEAEENSGISTAALLKSVDGNSELWLGNSLGKIEIIKINH